MRNIEDAARGMINPYRFIHSRNVALHSADLAGRFGVDEDRAYLAGITLDFCKEYPPDEMMEYALKAGGVTCFADGPKKLRFVTHRHITDEDLPRVAALVKKIHATFGT